jgi:hypothetical protein
MASHRSADDAKVLDKQALKTGLVSCGMAEYGKALKVCGVTRLTDIMSRVQGGALGGDKNAEYFAAVALLRDDVMATNIEPVRSMTPAECLGDMSLLVDNLRMLDKQTRQAMLAAAGATAKGGFTVEVASAWDLVAGQRGDTPVPGTLRPADTMVRRTFNGLAMRDRHLPHCDFMKLVSCVEEKSKAEEIEGGEKP